MVDNPKPAAPAVPDGVLDHLEAEARRFAGHYPQASDGHNTFLIFADKIAEQRAALAKLAPEPDGLVDLFTDQVVRDILSAKDVASGRERMRRAIRAAALTTKDTPHG